MYFEGVNFLTTGFILQRKRRRVSVKSPTGRMDLSHQASSIQCICASLTYNSFISPAVNSLHCEMDIARVTFLLGGFQLCCFRQHVNTVVRLTHDILLLHICGVAGWEVLPKGLDSGPTNIPANSTGECFFLCSCQY